MMRFAMILAVAVAAAMPARAEVKIEEVVSPGGITAWLVREPSIPFMAIETRFRGGASLDAADKRGAINLMTGLLEEGAGDLDARAFARAQESLAASFGYDVGDDSLSVSARFLSENRQEAIELLRKSIIEPSFADEALERVREQVLTGLRSSAKDPNEIARLTFDAMAYGTHPYATAYQGTIETVTALSRDDIVAAHKAVFAKDRIYVGAVGDVTPEELGVILDELFGDLPDTGAPMPERAEITIEGGTTVVEFETPQSVALFGHNGIAQDDPDFFAANVLNRVLGGGGFESRLMTEVREKRGLTYGVSSFLVPQDYAETVQGQVASANDSIAEAVNVIREEWARAAQEGITQEELDGAKTYITGAYPLRFNGNGPIARIMVGMQMLGLPIDYIATRNEKVEAVTLDDVRRVAGTLLNPDQLHFVVVGQPVGLASTVAD